ncbi:MAG: MerR family transcriptional regulator [Chloroflexota bacterium]
MFLSGEFSKISRVSKRLLHYYDDIGLLKPAHIDEENGYRYYSAKQLPDLNRILALKDLGLTLEQIKKLLDAELSDDEIQGMLLLKKAETEQAVFEETQRLKRIEMRLEQNRIADDEPDVVIKSIPAQPFFSTRAIFSTEDELFQLINQMTNLIPAAVSSPILGPMAGVFWEDSFSTSNKDIEIGFFLKRPIDKTIRLNDAHLIRCQMLPSVKTMATAVQAAGHDLEFIGLGNIARWIEMHGYKIAGPYREIIFDANQLSEIENATIEIQMPVEKANF